MGAAGQSTNAHRSFSAPNAREVGVVRTYALALAALVAALALVALVALIALPATNLSGGRAGSSARGLHAAGGRTFARPLPAALAAAASSRIGSSSRAFWPVRSGTSLLTRGGG